ncbi:MAG: hypothetical protein V4631_23145 [Pseudomonadota bacterium]
MGLELHVLRQQLLHEIQLAREADAGMHLYLLYTPELHDPLGLVGDTLRASAVIRPGAALKVVAAQPDRSPRLLTLDCRRVASYLLENDPALDDPAFEASITQCHDEICGAQTRDKLVLNDEGELSEFSVAGWLVSSEDAAALAARLKGFSFQNRGWVSWTHPAFVHALWPTMSASQRAAMLGGATWLALSLDGQLCRYAAGAGHSRPDSPAVAVDTALDARQARMVRNVKLVRELLPGWKAICTTQGRRLPANAEQLLHAHVIGAQDHGLDSDSVAMFVMTIVQLNDGASADAEWKSMMRAVADHGYALRDRLADLSYDFWDRYVPADVQFDEKTPVTGMLD